MKFKKALTEKFRIHGWDYVFEREAGGDTGKPDVKPKGKATANGKSKVKDTGLIGPAPLPEGLSAG